MLQLPSEVTVEEKTNTRSNWRHPRTTEDHKLFKHIGAELIMHRGSPVKAK